VVGGPLAPFARGFQERLAAQGYSAWTVSEHLLLMAHASRWLAGHRLDGVGLTEKRAEEFLRARRGEGFARPVSVRGLGPLLEYLRGVGAAPEPGLATATPLEDVAGRYQQYLRRERGLSPSSTGHYLAVARAFLAHLAVTTEAGLRTLTAADVTGFVLAQSRQRGRSYAKSIPTRLRSLLRFLHVEGLASGTLTAAVPSVASWRLTALPSRSARRVRRGCWPAVTAGQPACELTQSWPYWRASACARARWRPCGWMISTGGPVR